MSKEIPDDQKWESKVWDDKVRFRDGKGMVYEIRNVAEPTHSNSMWDVGGSGEENPNEKFQYGNLKELGRKKEGEDDADDMGFGGGLVFSFDKWRQELDSTWATLPQEVKDAIQSSILNGVKKG